MNPTLVQGQHALVYNPMLPPGWIEHRTPTGQPYWYNTITGKSSWLFPSPLPPLSQQEIQPKKKKKQIKKKLPGTNWLFVLTHDGYEFYYDRDTKTSVWEMPEKLKEPMEELKKLEEEQKEEKKNKLKQENEAKLAQKEKEDADNKKRLLEEEEAEQEAKRVKLEQEISQENDDKSEEHTKEEELEATEMTEEDIMWQLQQMAEAEVEETQATAQTTKEPKLSEEECLTQFNQLLAERNISPFAMYSTEYPKLMTDPRFSLVPHNKQKALFNKYCNELGEKIKNEKKSKKKPEDEFKELLVSKVTQKMYWDDFRRKYKDDPRFKALSVTREKEALFKDHVKHHLGKKRPTDEYMDLLRNTKDIRPGIRWRDAKKILEKDDRYYLIESKTDREDLFRDYLQDISSK